MPAQVDFRTPVSLNRKEAFNECSLAIPADAQLVLLAHSVKVERSSKRVMIFIIKDLHLFRIIYKMQEEL